jgi:hypothetical protein
MTSEARKLAWLSAYRAPEPDMGLQNWAFIWRFYRRSDSERQLCLCLIKATRTFEVHILRPEREPNRLASNNHYLAPMLRAQLTNAQLAAGMASILTRNHATTGD